MKTTAATFHDDFETALGLETQHDLSPLTMGSERMTYLQNEVRKLYSADKADADKLELTSEERIKAQDLMTMADVASAAEPIYGPATQLNTDTEPQEIAPMMRTAKKAPRWERIVNGIMGVMVATLVVCVLILLFAWR